MAEPTDNGQPQAPPVVPQPTPAAWQVVRVGQTDDGEPVLAMTLWLVTGSTTIFLNATEARRLSDDVRQHAGGVHLPPN